MEQALSLEYPMYRLLSFPSGFALWRRLRCAGGRPGLLARFPARFLALLLLASPVSAAHAQRVALLVGNASYSSAPLRNPPNDVREMEAALTAVGFKVSKLLNANQSQLKRAVRDFGNSARGAEMALLYYSGHGTQVRGENYLIPVGASIEKESDYEIEAVSANAVLAQLREAQPRAAVVVLDACRDNPHVASTKSLTKGLARMDAPTGTMIAFATAPNDVAQDNGLYARVLAKYVQRPGLELLDVFRDTASEVRRQSGGKQVPRVSEVSIDQRIYLAGPTRSGAVGEGRGTQLASLVPEATPSSPATYQAPVQIPISEVAPLTTSSTSPASQIKWDLPTAYPITSFHTVNINQFAADVEKASGGKLKITVHSGASLFKAPEIKRAVQAGHTQAGEILLANHQNEWQIFGADVLPFLADSYDEAAKLWKAQRPILERKLREQGMMVLYAVPWPPQGVYSKKPLNSVADLRGIKWRAYSPTTARIAELVGAQPVAVPAAEVSQAFATGVTESMISSGSTGFDAKLYEHVKFWYDTQAWLSKNALLVNKKAFDALDKHTQDAVLKAAADAEARGWEASKKANTESLEKLKTAGMQILPAPAALNADMKKVGDTMLKEWLDKAGLEGQALVDAFRK
jgi:TRAP-type transport system periplasmic protein